MHGQQNIKYLCDLIAQTLVRHLQKIQRKRNSEFQSITTIHLTD